MTRSRAKLIPFLLAVMIWCLIASALAWSNLSPLCIGGLGAGWITADEDWYLEHYGWPAQYRLQWTTVTTTGFIYQGKRIGPQSTSVRDEWCASGLMVDFATATIMLTSTALVLKNWLRSARLTQLSLKSVVITIAAIAILMALYRARNELDAMLPQDLAARSAWALPNHLKIPISIGIGCVAFVTLSSVASMVGSLVNILRHGRCREHRAACPACGPDGGDAVS
jgi:hypothetical protein